MRRWSGVGAPTEVPGRWFDRPPRDRGKGLARVFRMDQACKEALETIIKRRRDVRAEFTFKQLFNRHIATVLPDTTASITPI